MPTYTKSIQYNPADRDFTMELNGELVGYAQTFQAADATLDALITDLLRRDADTVAAMEAEAAAELASISAPVAVAVYQVGATAMYEVFVAGHRYHLHDAHDMGIAWMGGEGERISPATFDGLMALWRSLFAPDARPTPAQVAAACEALAEEYRDAAAGLEGQDLRAAAKDLRAAATAAEKAAFSALEGEQVARWVGATLMVRSANEAGKVYAVRVSGCCCKAAEKHQHCWHGQLFCGWERAMEAMEAGYALAA